MPTKLLDGKKIAGRVRAEITEALGHMPHPPRLGIVLVGDDAASAAYVRQKERAGEELGIPVEIFRYPADISAGKLRQEVARIGRMKKISGLIVQLPLPEGVQEARVVNAIPPEKDVDVLGKTAFGAFIQNTSPIMPPTVGAIVRLLEEYHIPLAGKHAVLIGAGRLVGMPMAIKAVREGATVSLIDERTKDPERITREADIIITGTPMPDHVGTDMVPPGAVVIDAGFARNAEGKITGNVIFDDVSKKASYITPVPGGIGPMTVAMLFCNLVTLAKLRT